MTENGIQKLKDIIQVQKEIIAWYESDHDFSTYGGDEIPEFLRELYKQLDKLEK